MRGTRGFGWVVGAAVAAAVLAGAAPAGAAVNPFVTARGPLSDLAPSTANPTDGGFARVYSVAVGDWTYVVLLVSGLDPAAEGNTYGAHVHVGPCVAGNGAAAGPHYLTGGTPSPETEVWLDFEVLPGGFAYATAFVPFQIEEGAAQSVVIHAEPTQEGGPTPGAAGGRLACLPVPF